MVVGVRVGSALGTWVGYDATEPVRLSGRGRGSSVGTNGDDARL